MRITQFKTQDRVLIALKEGSDATKRSSPCTGVLFGYDNNDDLVEIELENASSIFGPDLAVTFSVVNGTQAPNRPAVAPMPLESKPKTNWFWPQSNAGQVLFVLVILVSFLTFFIDPLFFWVNALFWYLVLVVIRAFFIWLLSPDKPPKTSGKKIA